MQFTTIDPELSCPPIYCIISLLYVSIRPPAGSPLLIRAPTSFGTTVFPGRRSSAASAELNRGYGKKCFESRPSISSNVFPSNCLELIKMVVKLRLSRFGNKHSPFYNIVVAQARYVFLPESSAQKWPRLLCRLLSSASLKHRLFRFLDANSWSWRRSARDSKPLEVIGTYNPIPQRPTNLTDEEARTAKAYKEIALDRSRAKYWLGVGAQPSEPVWRLLSMVCWQCLSTPISLNG